jgi:hypothetical protein
MPNVLTQRRLVEIGRLRLGDEKQPNRPGAQLDTFRFTSTSQKVVEMAAGIYGGTVAEFRGSDDDAWQVIFERKRIQVLIPPVDAFTSWMEKWTGPVLERRCDGEVVTTTEDSPDGAVRMDQPCLCGVDVNRYERECKPRLRLNLILSELPISGQVLLQAGGWHASDTIGSLMQSVADVMEQRVLDELPTNFTPASIWIAPKTTKSKERGTRHFKTLMMTLGASIAELAAPREAPQLPTPDGDEIDTTTGEITDGSAATVATAVTTTEVEADVLY